MGHGLVAMPLGAPMLNKDFIENLNLSSPYWFCTFETSLTLSGPFQLCMMEIMPPMLRLWCHIDMEGHIWDMGGKSLALMSDRPGGLSPWLWTFLAVFP